MDRNIIKMIIYLLTILPAYCLIFFQVVQYLKGMFSSGIDGALKALVNIVFS